MINSLFTRLGVLGLVAVFAVACAQQGAQVSSAPSGPVTLAAAGAQPGALEPGLAVKYTFGDFGHVDEVAARIGGTGAPDSVVPDLSFRAGDGRKVLDTNSDDLVGAVFSGYLRFAKAGSYQMSATSNDGVQVMIGGQVVLEDPRPHPDRSVGPNTVSVAEAGWYPIKVVWFERKGSYSLILQWSDGTGPVAIPPEFFGH